MSGLQEFADQQAEIDALRQANWRLQMQVRAVKARSEQLVSAAHRGALDAMVALGPVQPVPARPKDGRKRAGGEEVALWVMGDWQIGKRTPSYDTAVGRRRAMDFATKAAKITETHRSARPVNKCVVVFGGDMVEGACFQFPSQPFEIDSTIFDQYVNTARIMVDVVRAALACYPEVTVVAEYGNHGRIGSKRDVLPRSDNVDRMSFALARAMLTDEPRLMWDDSAEDVQRLEIGNYRALVMHGDEVGRGGFASPMTLVRHADRWASGAYPWEFTDVFIHHYHQHQEWGMANGRGHVYMTGSLESENRYARETMAASAVPSQRLHFVNPEAGITTAQYQLYVP